MVEPEVDEHFLQLPRAVNRTDDFLLLQLEDDGRSALLLFRIHSRSGLVAAFLRLLGLTRLLERNFEFFGDLTRAQAQCRQIGQPGIDARVAETLRMQLLVDVSLEADGANVLDIAGPRAERHATDDMPDSRVVCWQILLGGGHADDREKGNKSNSGLHKYRI